MFQTKVVVEIKKHILHPINFFRMRAIYEMNVEKYGRVGQGTDDNIQ
jgi:hypothetical protein